MFLTEEEIIFIFIVKNVVQMSGSYILYIGGRVVQLFSFEENKNSCKFSMKDKNLMLQRKMAAFTLKKL